MRQYLLLAVRLHGDGLGTGRYHGTAQGNPEWPPAPARVYQALVAGAARGRVLSDAIVSALTWLEGLPPPVIVAPQRRLGQALSLFVPNNDADALADPRDVSSIRTKKAVHPSLFDADLPLLYGWPLSGGPGQADAIIAAALDLYQLGRGVDMAFAHGELLDDEVFSALLEKHPGVVHRPEPGGRGGPRLACPLPGSLESLVRRHQAEKLMTGLERKDGRVLFSNPPKPRFREVSYQRAKERAVFELRERDHDKPWPWSLRRVSHLVERIRDAAADRLRRALPGSDAAIERVIVGRKADGRDPAPIEQRVRIVPLPSIGFEHADRAIRRVVLEVPVGGGLSVGDVEWAFSGLDWTDPVTGEMSPWVVTRTDDSKMLEHYMGPSRRWRSVTAAALPVGSMRRRIEPTRQREDAKSAAERRSEEQRAASAVHTALRHARVSAIAVVVRVQREPFEAKGARAEQFAEDTRFEKERLWHLDIELDRAVDGPLVIGDGRFLGLGVMAPVHEETTDVHVFSVVEGLSDSARSGDVAHALRRAVMARVQAVLGPREPLPSFFSGHGVDGGPAKSSAEPHLAFVLDTEDKRLMVVAPHRLDRCERTRTDRDHLHILDAALEGFRELLAGDAGRLSLVPTTLDAPRDPVFGRAREWVSQTPYVVTRHGKKVQADEALANDLRSECRRVGLPEPRVHCDAVWGEAGVGLMGRLRLAFHVAVEGPVVLGRDRHRGGGLFRASPHER